MINKVFTVSEQLYFHDLVEIQTNISDKGLPVFEISGLVSKSVEESKKRVFISLQNSGFQFPLKNILVNIAPASIPKSGTHYDLGIAVSIIKDSIKIPYQDSVFIGELSFDGEVRNVDNIFYLANTAVELGYKNLYVPKSSINSLIYFNDVNIYPLENLKELCFLDKIQPHIFIKNKIECLETPNITYKYIKGNFLGKKVLAYSLIGRHSLLISGSPGVGKSMLAKSMIDLAPDLTKEEFISVSKMYSYSGLDIDRQELRPPFRNPHPLSSYSAIFGSFTGKLLPGEVSLANKGVLFLDEFPEFNRQVIEGLRVPLENKMIQLSRSGIKTNLECDFILVASCNPCKCGYFNHSKISCKCSPQEIRRYQSRISGPIMDRIDINLFIPETNIKEDDEYKNYPELEFSKIKNLIREKFYLRKKLLNIIKPCDSNESIVSNKIIHNYIPNKIYNILINELKNVSISERVKNKFINLIFTICLFNNREIISIEDIYEGISLTIKNRYL